MCTATSTCLPARLQIAAGILAQLALDGTSLSEAARQALAFADALLTEHAQQGPRQARQDAHEALVSLADLRALGTL